jgi:hypothetical protein
MNRVAAVILAIGFLMLGTGTMEYLHNLEHAREDAAEAAIANATGQPVQEAPHHDENNCPVHAQLHMPALPVAWVPLLILLGVFVAFLTMLAPQLAPQPAFVRIDCRGPPSRI